MGWTTCIFSFSLSLRCQSVCILGFCLCLGIRCGWIGKLRGGKRTERKRKGINECEERIGIGIGI